VQINVNVTDAGPQHGRVVVVNEPMLRGDLLAAIPIDLVWNANANGANHSLQVRGAQIMNSGNFPLKPFTTSGRLHHDRFRV
jgi:hypothetical protein